MESYTGTELTMFPLYFLYGLPVAAAVGIPFALLIAWPLRRVRNQWFHVLAFAAAMGQATLTLVLLASRGSIDAALVGSLFAAVLGAALAGAIGRAVVIRIVALRNR